MDSQTPFRHRRDFHELNPHPFLINGVPDNPLKRDILLPSSQDEENFRPYRKRIRVGDKNSLQAYVPDGRGSCPISDLIPRFGLKSRRNTSIC